MLDPDTAALIFFTFVPNAIPSPNAAGTVIYGGPFLMNQTGAVILTAAAQAPNYPQSAAMHWAFNCPSVLPPTFSPQPIATAVSACPLQVTINTNNAEWGSGVFVTTNGTMPSPQQNMQVAGNLTGQVAVTVPVTSKGVPNQTTTTTLGAISCIANGLYCSPPVLNQKYTCPGPPPSFDRMNITIGTGNDQSEVGHGIDRDTHHCWPYYYKHLSAPFGTTSAGQLLPKQRAHHTEQRDQQYVVKF